jgi:hypothetical protein
MPTATRSARWSPSTPGTAALVRQDERARTRGERSSRGAGRRHGGRVLYSTDGPVEECEAGGKHFGDGQPIDRVNRVECSQAGVQAAVGGVQAAVGASPTP